MIRDDALVSSTNEIRMCRVTGIFQFLALMAMCLFLSGSGVSQVRSTDDVPITDVSFCELVENPQKFDQKMIRIAAVYRYGQYWNELYCPGCKREDRISFEIGTDFESKTPKKFRRRIKHSDRGRTLNVIVVGKFVGSGNFGHRGSQHFALIVDAIEDAQIILKDSPYLLPDKLVPKAICRCGDQSDSK